MNKVNGMKTGVIKLDYMVGPVKFQADNDNRAVTIAKQEMFKNGWRNLRLLKKGPNGWEVCKVIPSYETKENDL